jgi:trans-2,3-dihydro-3-hydroxyanthranilate isomerase
VPNYRFVQLDVFTDQAFAGNPLAVFPEAEGLTDEQMLKIAREMNLSETVFVLDPEKAPLPAKANPKTKNDDPTVSETEQEVANKPPAVRRRLRIFTPAREIPFAGHPIVGTWNQLAREGVVPVPTGEMGGRVFTMRLESESCRSTLNSKRASRCRS